MRRFSNPLDHVRIAAPCSADWEQMIGNDRVRSCGHCKLNVYNLSELSRREAEFLISSNERRLCARFYRRVDGSILTKNCPVGLRAIRRRLAGLAKAASAAVITFFAGLGIYSLSKSTVYAPEPRMGVIAQPLMMGDIAVGPTERIENGYLAPIPMGMVAISREKRSRAKNRRSPEPEDRSKKGEFVSRKIVTGGLVIH